MPYSVTLEPLVKAYAVFRQTVTVTWYNGSTTASTSTGYNYYNNGAVVNFSSPKALRNPSSILFSRSFMVSSAKGSPSSEISPSSLLRGDAMGIQIVDKKLKAAYAGTQKIKMAMYQGKKIWSAGSTVTYMVDTNVSYTEEVDSDTSCLIRGIAGAPAPGRPAWQGRLGEGKGGIDRRTARGWSTGTAGNSGITYNNGAAFTRDSNITLYGAYSYASVCNTILICIIWLHYPYRIHDSAC